MNLKKKKMQFNKKKLLLENHKDCEKIYTLLTDVAVAVLVCCKDHITEDITLT